MRFFDEKYALKQPNPWGCLATCCCMAAQKPYESFVEFVGHDGSQPISDDDPDPVAFDWIEAARYLLEHGISMGMVVDIEDGELSVKEVNNGFTLRLTLRKLPAIIIVKSETTNQPQYTHAIFWDGYRVYDPSPASENHRLLATYEVRRIYPLHYYEGACKSLEAEDG